MLLLRKNQYLTRYLKILKFIRPIPANTKHNICTTSAQRLRRWSNIVQMFYRCFVFAGMCLVNKFRLHVCVAPLK